MAEVLIRPASGADADQIAALFLDCWTTSYAQVLPAELVAKMDIDRSLRIWRSALAKVGLRILVAVDRAEPDAPRGLVGFRPDDDGTGYISSLYVSPRVQGGGIGRVLLSRAEDELAAEGVQDARLWVFAGNEPSLAFYRRQGWEIDGREEVDSEWGHPQRGMSKRLRLGSP